MQAAVNLWMGVVSLSRGRRGACAPTPHHVSETARSLEVDLYVASISTNSYEAWPGSSERSRDIGPGGRRGWLRPFGPWTNRRQRRDGKTNTVRGSYRSKEVCLVHVKAVIEHMRHASSRLNELLANGVRKAAELRGRHSLSGLSTPLSRIVGNRWDDRIVQISGSAKRSRRFPHGQSRLGHALSGTVGTSRFGARVPRGGIHGGLRRFCPRVHASSRSNLAFWEKPKSGPSGSIKRLARVTRRGKRPPVAGSSSRVAARRGARRDGGSPS